MPETGRAGGTYMNIKEAKEQIKYAVAAYFTKDDMGRYVMPIERQRPIFLMGPPGIGKTAVMEQVAQELGIALVSYSMTHHTRQSALGLPLIVHKNYDGFECDVSEYTMSEIISSIYDLMQKTGVKEGILFLDEINCVSETLSPVMLQFLQYKIFGKHKVPEGWVVVTAGNPPEYNNSVREFDIVTWDRLKRIDVEPDYDAWKEYAYKAGVHSAVLTYLEIKKYNFYHVESTVGGKIFVTARGWEDLSRMIQLYEEHGFPVDEQLTAQYLQDPAIARDFASYYDLFNKYRSDYEVESILKGKASGDIKGKAEEAGFDERLSLMGLLLDAVMKEMTAVVKEEGVDMAYMKALKEFRLRLKRSKTDAAGTMEELIEKYRTDLDKSKKAGRLSAADEDEKYRLIDLMEKAVPVIGEAGSGDAAFKLVSKDFDARVKELKKKATAAGKCLSNVFKFSEEVFGDGQEMLLFVTDLTINFYAMRFISRYGCKEYFKHNKDLLLYERQQEISEVLEKLELGDEE